MSVTPNEPAQGQTPDDANGGHPAWQELLDKLPEDLHSVVRPQLEDWDKRQQDKLQEVHKQYDPLKPFVEHDPQELQNALALLEQFQQNPTAVIEQAIEFFELNDKFVPAGQQQSVKPDDDPEGNPDPLSEMGIDLLNHPALKTLAENYEKLNTKLTAREQQEQQQEQNTALENMLSGLETEHGKFDRLYVTALMSNGVDAETAVKTYFDTINSAVAAATQQTKTETPPVVLGGDGTTGSGIPQNPTKMGDLTPTQVNDVVAQIIQRSQEAST